jgi:hypothetical protein
MTPEQAGDEIFEAAIRYSQGRVTDFAEVTRKIMEAARRDALLEAIRAVQGIGADDSQRRFKDYAIERLSAIADEHDPAEPHPGSAV